MKQKEIPILLLTGYLGSGKTTLVNRILANKRGIRFAVIVNDIGEVNIDASLIQKGGVVGKIDGLENAVEKCQSVITYENRYPVGSETPCGDTLRQLMMRFVLICKSRKQMSEDINYLNKTIDVKDSNGVNLVVKMDPLRVFGID